MMSAIKIGKYFFIENYPYQGNNILVGNNMKLGNKCHKTLSDESGQSLVEFLLLLTVIMGLSLGTLKIINGNIANYWESFANLIIDDPSSKVKL
jgi:hypothetical protein